MKLNDKDKVKIYHLRQSGWTWSQLRQRFNVSKAHLTYLVRLMDKHGIETVPKGKNRYYLPNVKEKIINEVLLKGRSLIRSFSGLCTA